LSVRQKAENIFGWIGKSSAQKPWHYITFSFLLLLASLWQLQYLVINTTTEGFLKKDDPAIVTFEAFKNEFGRDVQLIVSVQSDDIFNPEFIREFIRLHKALAEQVPYVDEVDSLYNVRDIYGDDGELIVQGFFDELPESDVEWAAKKRKALQHPLYKNIYISADGKMVNIYVRPDITYAVREGEVNKAGFAMMRKMLSLYSGIGGDVNDKHEVPLDNAASQAVHYEPLGELQNHDMIASIRHVITQFPDLGKNIHIAGTPVLTDELSYYLVQDMLKFIAMAIVVIAAVLYFLYRSLWGVVLPLIVVVTALVTTMALMSITGQSVQSPTVILPSFVMAVGISNTIHLVSIWLMKMRAGEAKAVALEHALMRTGVPIFFTTMTTVAGLLSFGSSDIVPIANLGFFSAAGVFFAFLYTIILLPALITVTPAVIKPEAVRNRVNWIDRFITFSIHFSKKYTVGIVVGSAMIAIVSLYGASQLRFSHDPIQWLPETSYGRQAIEIVSKKIGGTVPVEIIIDTGELDGVKDAAFMRLLDESVMYLETYKTEKLAVGKVLAVSTLLKETNMALHDNVESAYVIPDNRELIAQEFLMLETSGAEDLFRMVDSNYQKARITVLTPWVDALYFGEYIRGMEIMLQDKFGDTAEVQITGIVPMLSKTLKKIMYSTAQSYGFAFLVITFMMILLLGSVKYGLVSILPNVMPITMVLALMYVVGAPLDMFSMLIGSIAMGLAVDDTVHFMDGFQNKYKQTGDADRAIAETLSVSGRAMLSTSMVLTLGFLIYLFSPMNNLEDFGLYTALCIVLALLADFWMAPALLRWMHRGNNR
jgi:uncharacterized protein